MEFLASLEKAEIKAPSPEGFKEIKPETGITPKEAKEFWDKQFSEMKSDNESTETPNEKLDSALKDYIQDLKAKSEVADTIPDHPFEASDLQKISPEQKALAREEFDDKKKDLISQWEDAHNCSWPTYKEDVYITNKHGDQVLIREAGSRFDAHHIQSLSLGGKNEVSNITPLSADIHYDHRGVHAPGSPYDKLDKMVGGVAQ